MGAINIPSSAKGSEVTAKEMPLSLPVTARDSTDSKQVFLGGDSPAP